MNNNKKPKFIFFRQTCSTNLYFFELFHDFAQYAGNTLAYTCFPDEKIDAKGLPERLTIKRASRYNRKSYFSRLASSVLYTVKSFPIMLFSSRESIIFVVTQPSFITFAAWLNFLIKRQPYYIWVDDVYPDAITANGLASEKNWLIKLWKVFNKLSYAKAKKTFTLGPCMKNRVAQYTSQERIEIIPTWVDTTAIYPIKNEKNYMVKELNLDNKIVVSFSGNIGLSHDLDILLEAAKKLENEKEFAFLIIGKGGGLQQLKETAKRLRLTNVTFMPLQPKEKILYSMNLADIGIVSLRKGFQGISMPSKTYYMMATGTAILGVSQSPSDIEELIQKYDCGTHIANDDVNGLVSALFSYKNNPDRLKTHQTNARLAAENNCSRELNIKKLLSIVCPDGTRQAGICDKSTVSI